MSEVHDQALQLLTAQEPGIYLTPAGREMVLRALDEVHTLRRRAEDTEKKLAQAHESLALVAAALHNVGLAKDSPAPAEAKEGSELAPPAAAPSPTPEQVAGDVPEGSTAPSGESREAATPNVGTGEARAVETASDSPAAAKWAHTGRSAWHLFKDPITATLLKSGEWSNVADCGEEVVGTLLYAPKPIFDNTCLDCAAMVSITVPEPEPASTTEPPKTCAGHNKSAKTICGSTAVSVQRGDKWFCKRHDPEKSKVCLVPGCGEPGRTAKGSSGIWCKNHAAKLSAAERGSIAERVKRLEAA